MQFPAGNRSFLYSDGMQPRGSRDATYLHRRHPRCWPLLRPSASYHVYGSHSPPMLATLQL